MHEDTLLLLGIDVGTTNCKALVFDTAGVFRDDAEALAGLRHAALYDRCYREVYQQLAPALAQAQHAIGELGLEQR